MRALEFKAQSASQTSDAGRHSSLAARWLVAVFDWNRCRHPLNDCFPASSRRPAGVSAAMLSSQASVDMEGDETGKDDGGGVGLPADVPAVPLSKLPSGLMSEDDEAEAGVVTPRAAAAVEAAAWSARDAARIAEMEEEIEQLNDEVEALEDELDDRDDEIKELKEAVGISDVESKALRAEVEKLKAQVTALTTAVSEPAAPAAAAEPNDALLASFFEPAKAMEAAGDLVAAAALYDEGVKKVMIHLKQHPEVKAVWAPKLGSIMQQAKKLKAAAAAPKTGWQKAVRTALPCCVPSGLSISPRNLLHSILVEI